MHVRLSRDRVCLCSVTTVYRLLKLKLKECLRMPRFSRANISSSSVAPLHRACSLSSSRSGRRVYVGSRLCGDDGVCGCGESASSGVSGEWQSPTTQPATTHSSVSQLLLRWHDLANHEACPAVCQPASERREWQQQQQSLSDVGRSVESVGRFGCWCGGSLRIRFTGICAL